MCGEMLSDKHFIDWEAHVWGYGYGTGEQYTLKALKDFFDVLHQDEYGGYDYVVLEGALTPPTAWLMINILCHQDILSYGTSPRHGWLTPKGKLLRAYLSTRSVETLYELVTDPDPEQFNCFPGQCQCEVPCKNPLWVYGHANPSKIAKPITA